MHGRMSVVNAAWYTVTMFGWLVELAEGAALPLERPLLGLGLEPAVQHLDRHVAVQRDLPGAIDDGVPPGADPFQIGEALDRRRRTAVVTLRADVCTVAVAGTHPLRHPIEPAVAFMRAEFQFSGSRGSSTR